MDLPPDLHYFISASTNAIIFMMHNFWEIQDLQKVLFRADWTDPPTIETALQYTLGSRARRREGLHLAPFYAELVGYRWSSPAKIREGLERAGPKAVKDFERATQRWQKRGSRPGRIELDD